MDNIQVCQQTFVIQFFCKNFCTNSIGVHIISTNEFAWAPNYYVYFLVTRVELLPNEWSPLVVYNNKLLQYIFYSFFFF